MHLNC